MPPPLATTSKARARAGQQRAFAADGHCPVGHLPHIGTTGRDTAAATLTVRSARLMADECAIGRRGRQAAAAIRSENSTRRLENPHSLSYQPRTLTWLPTASVSGASKIDE
jgi:hypothetical protein